MMLDEMVRTVKEFKESVVANDSDDRDIATVIHFYRDGVPVALGVMRPDRDRMLQAIGLCIPGLRCHGVSIAMETYQTSTMTNPMTGERWAPGEMQVYFDAGNRDHVIFEAITLTMAAMEGEPQMAVLPYVYEGDKVVWQDPEFDVNETVGAGGYVLDTIKEFFANSVDSREKYARMEAALPPEERVNVMAMADALTMMLLVRAGMERTVGLAVEKGSEYEAKIRGWLETLEVGVEIVTSEEADDV